MSSPDTECPVVVSNTILHGKEGDKERYIMPFTRYGNVFGAPTVLSELDQSGINVGAPFNLLVIDEVHLTTDQIRQYFGTIL